MLAGYPPLPRRREVHTPTTRAPSVLGVCGWVSAPRTAHPRVGNALGSFTWGMCSAASGCAAHYHTLEQPAEPPHTSYVRAERARADHTAPILHPRTRGVHTERLRSHASDPCIPARPLTVRSGPATDTTQPPRHDDAREVDAGRARGGRTVRGDCPRSRGHRLGVVFPSSPMLSNCLIPPLKDTNSTPARPGCSGLWLVVPSERPWATQRPLPGGIRAPRTAERRADRSSATAGSCYRAMGGAVAPGTCAACAALAYLWRRASTARDDPAR